MYPRSSRRISAALLSGRAWGEARNPLQVEKSCATGPRILVQKPLPVLVCPLLPQEIRAFLARLGPSAAYGLRVIRLRQECLLHPAGITFAEYVVPGEIHLYAVPASPWQFPFVPSRSDSEAFARHGANVRVDKLRGLTTVAWTESGLKSFLLCEVLAHEIGHHRLQHNRGKRQAQICRRFDHEACADLYSRRMSIKRCVQSIKGRIQKLLPMNNNSFTLIGEEITGDWNAQALADIARAFGGEYAAYAGHSGDALQTGDIADTEELPDSEQDLLNGFDWLLAAENGRNAQSVYALKPPAVPRRALIVGNEAKGLRRKTLKRSHAAAEIPIASQNINCLNVAAAAAVMLYYLTAHESRSSPLGQAGRTLNAVQKARPDILLLGGRDPMELGSVVRSACALGWERVFLADRHNAWYACDRLMKSEGRGAARRGRNPIKVIPCPDDLLAHYKTIVVVTMESALQEQDAVSPHTNPFQKLHQSLLTKRPEGAVLIVLPDESENSDLWLQSARETHCLVYATLPAISSAQYHYRQTASIALAEIARQLGKADGKGIYLHGKKQRYQKSVEEDADATAHCGYDLEDLRIF